MDDKLRNHFFAVLDEKDRVLTIKNKILIDIWSLLNTIEDKTDTEKQIYQKVLECINVQYGQRNNEHIAIAKELVEN